MHKLASIFISVCEGVKVIEIGQDLTELRCHAFTALHGMQSRYSDGNSVCLSVCQTRAL